MESYWETLRRRPVRRRTFVRGAVIGAGGAASLALVGCGDDDDDDDDATTAPATSTETAAPATSTATSAATGTSTEEATGTEEPAGTAAAVATEPEGLVRGGTATWGTGGSITHVDPHRDAPVPGLAVATTVYSGLIRNEISGGETLNQHPDVAESWEQPDDTTFTFSLRDGVTWWDRPPTDGRALTAEDVVANFQRMVSPEPDFSTRELFTSMETVEAVDEKTVRFVMTEPDAYFLINVGSALPRLLAPEIHEGDLAKQNVAGAGPFQPSTDTIDLTQTIEFVKNPNFYIEGAPYLDNIVMNIIVDAAARDAAMRGGDIDWIEQFSYNPDVIEGFQGELPDVQVFDYAYFPHKANMNTRKEPFGDKRVRQAVAHAMDQQGFLDLVNFGKGRQAWAMPPWLGDWAVNESEFPAFDPAASIALLEAAGYPDGFEVTDSVFTGYDFYSVATQEQLAAVNITTNIELSEFGVWYGNVYSGGNYDFCTTGDFQFENPDRNLRTYYHSKGTLNNTFLHETDPDAVAEFDKLLDDARRSLDIDEQKALLGDAQRWMFENVPAAYGGYIYTVILIQGRLQNFNIQPAYTTGGLQGMQFGYMWVNDA